jgi:hypothetical protein
MIASSGLKFRDCIFDKLLKEPPLDGRNILVALPVQSPAAFRQAFRLGSGLGWSGIGITPENPARQRRGFRRFYAE